MPILTFSRKHILNSDIHPTEPGVSYRTQTTSGIFGRKHTSLIPLSHSPYRGIPAAIHWKDGQFEIGGVRQRWSDLKQKSGGIFSSAREWRWSNASYTVKYNHMEWMATCNSSRHPEVAIFSLRKSRLFGSSEPASFLFPPGLPVEDVVFLILIFLYSETKRQGKNQAAAAAASSSAAAAASSSAAASAPGC